MDKIMEKEYVTDTTLARNMYEMLNIKVISQSILSNLQTCIQT